MLKREKFFDAGMKFKKAFFPEIDFLESTVVNPGLGNKNTAHNIIKAALSRHRHAMWEFREFFHRESTNRLNFQNAWNKYTGTDKWDSLREYIDDFNIPADFVEYSTKTSSEEDEIENRKLALCRIYKMFEFTKPEIAPKKIV